MELEDEKSKGERNKQHSARIKSNSVSELRRRFEEKITCENKSAINGINSWTLTGSTSKISKLQEDLKKDSLLYSDKLVRPIKRVSFCLSVEEEKTKPTPAPRNKLTRTASVPTQIFKVEVRNVQKETVKPIIINLSQDENSNIIQKPLQNSTKQSEILEEDTNTSIIKDNFPKINSDQIIKKDSSTTSKLQIEVIEEKHSIVEVKKDSRKDKKLSKESKFKKVKSSSNSKKENKVTLEIKKTSPKPADNIKIGHIDLKKEELNLTPLESTVVDSSDLAEPKLVTNKQDFLVAQKPTDVPIVSNVITSDIVIEAKNKNGTNLKQQSNAEDPNYSNEIKEESNNKIAENLKINTEEDLNLTNKSEEAVDYKYIVFAEPEDQHLIVRAESSDDSLNKIESDLDQFIMDNNKVKERKRSNSFKRIFKGGIFGNSKKKEEKEVKKSTKKTENAVFADNAQNESFNRKPHNYEQLDSNFEQHIAQMHINRFQQAKANFERTNDYVCMENPRCHNNTNQPETSSSSNTLDSETLIYENKNSNLRTKFFETPPRAHETYQNVQLVKPKALIPINSERPLPNPYQDKPSKTIERNLNANSPKNPSNKINEIDVIYGTVYDQKDKHNSYASSDSTKSLEITKLKLPINRERVDLQPRLKSPIPQSTISTDKIIATELLKDKKSLNSPTHQKLEIELDYPRNEVQNNQFTTNVLVHVDSPNRSITPTRSLTHSTSSLQRTPPKHEIRQSVEAFCWKELKKLKEREDYELQMRIQSTPFGHAEEPIMHHRSRGLSPSITRNTRRSASLPRDVLRQKQQEEMDSKKIHVQPNFSRNSPQRSTIGGYQNVNQKPIFKRGSLSQQHFLENQAIYNKKVSFNGADHQQPWPTKNGYTQSPPQRRVDMKREISMDDDVFLPNESSRPLTREEIFMINQQKQKQMQQAHQTNMVRRMPDIKEGAANQGRYDYPPSDATYDSFDSQNKNQVINGQEGIYGSHNNVQQRSPQGAHNLTPDNIYGTRNVHRSNYNNREPMYGARSQNEPTYGVRSQNDPTYGTRTSNYGSNGTVYGSNKNIVTKDMIDSNYISKNMIDRNYGPKVMNNPNYGTRSYNGRNVNEPIYGAKVANEPIYGAKVGNEPIYGAKITNDPNYGVRRTNESLYATKYSNESISRNSNEPIYGTRHTNDANYGLRSPNGDPIYGRRLDFSPHQKLNSVNNKVCDIYGKIHDSQDHRVVSPPASQTSGVLYGQLQRNMNAPPMQYQSYNQIQNNSNFVRGSRLTASVNDMYNRRYQADPRHHQRQEQVYEPPNRPLPPIPNDHRSKFGLRRRNIANNDNNASNPRFLPGK